MQYRVNKILEDYGIGYGAKVIVALSGGVDSMVLLTLLKNSSWNLKLYAAHVNFHLRGEESDGDEMFVREWCDQNNVELFVKQADTLTYSDKNKISVEMAARDIRYNWFVELLADNRIGYLAVAHNANDNAETLILNVLRGSGLEGCTGIKENRFLGNGVKVIRPLLSFTRKDIEHCAANLNIPYRTDSTNADIKYSRNKIRHKVLPVLEQINPSAVKSLNKTISYLSSANNILKSWLNERLCIISNGLLESFKGFDYRHFPACKHLESVYSLELIKQESEPELIIHHILSEYGFSSANEEQLCNLLPDNKSSVFFSETHVAQKERGLLKIYKCSVVDNIESVTFDLQKKSKVHFGGLNINFAVESASNLLINRGKVGEFRNLVVDFDKCKGGLIVSSFENGDRMKPFGMNGFKKVADILSDLKVDLQNKKNIPVLKTLDGRIIAIVGVMIDNDFRLSGKTENGLKISVI